MQTLFTAAQLTDPRNAESERILRKCVHCGFCTATCPTYVLLGDELDSPRGRIVLIKDMLEQGRAATPEVVRHVDRCLSCLACVTTCPSGVDYRHLVEHARSHIERTYRRPWLERRLRAFIATTLPDPVRFRRALRWARWARPLAPLLPRPLRALLAKAPREAPRPASVATGRGRAPATGKARIALLSGCAQSVVAPAHHAATLRVLEAAGAEVVTFGGCCGALTHHMGLEEHGRATATLLLDRLEAERAARGLDAIVTSASGCGLHVKDYGHVFASDPQRAAIAGRVGALARDAASMVAALGLPTVSRPTGERVAYHPPCTLQHGLRTDAAPRALLRAAGYDVVEVEESHLCCGSAGTYNLLQPALAEELRERKLERLRRTGASIVATDNVGCAMQLDTPEGPRVVHTMELLDRALNGAPLEA